MHADTVKHSDTVANGTGAVTDCGIVGTSHRLAPDTGLATGQAAVSPVVNKDSTIVKADKKKAPARTAKEEEQKRKAWHPMLYFSLTPSLAFQKVTPMRNDDIHISGLQEQSLISGNRAGISLETGGQITLLKGFDLYGGLAYYQQSQSVTYNYTLPSSTNINSQESMDYVISPEGGTHTFRYAMRNAGVSAGFLYTVKDAKLMHKIGAGLQYQRGFMKSTQRRYLREQRISISQLPGALPVGMGSNTRRSHPTICTASLYTFVLVTRNAARAFNAQAVPRGA